MSFLQTLLNKQNAERVAATQQAPAMPVRQPQLPVDAGLAESMLVDRQYLPYNLNTNTNTDRNRG